MRIANFFVLTAFAYVIYMPSVMAIERMRLGHGSPEDTTIHKATMKFAELVKQRSKGEIEISVFSNSVLGAEVEMLQHARSNVIDLAKLSGSLLETAGVGYKVFNLPFVFDDRKHFLKVLQSPVGESILNSTRDYGVIGLVYYDAGVRSFYGKKPIGTPEDLKGARIRVMQNQTTLQMIQALGGSAIPMPWAEVYPAMKIGLVDMAENNILALTSGKHGEITKFYSDTEQQMIPDVLVMSTSRWNSLSKSHQDIIKQAAIESSKFQMKLWAEEERVEIEKAEKMGVKFIRSKRELFINKVKPMIEVAKKDPSIAKILDQIAVSK